ncbi:hypothetical protein [Rickettsia endosymbiont of Orchestes rusci]|uniref:hypothetical protein n=1 Tax=Rickettsia endosymbiont of Orchestes rusci TaxID=3066250 RepID=UPI00313F3228
MKREFHAPFCERLVGKFCWSTLPELTEKLIAEGFGDQIANQVESLSRNKKSGKISSEEILNILVAS